MAGHSAEGTSEKAVPSIAIAIHGGISVRDSIENTGSIRTVPAIIKVPRLPILSTIAPKIGDIIIDIVMGRDVNLLAVSWDNPHFM